MSRLSKPRLLATPSGAVGASVMLALVATALTRPLADPDTWWHLWSGQWMLDHRSILRADLMTFTSHGEPYLPHSWLAEVLMAAVERLTDLRGLLVLRAGLVVATYGVLAAIVLDRVASRRLEGWGFVVLAAFAGAVSWAVRPYLLSYLFLMCTLVLATREDRRRWLLVPLFIVWANSHGLWILGLGVLGLVALARSVDQRQMDWTSWAVALSSGLATLINPFGWELHAQLIELSTTMKSVQVLEWRTTDFTRPSHWAWALLVATAVALLLRRRRSVGLLHWGLVLTSLALGLYAVRNLAPTALILAFVAAELLPGSETRFRRGTRALPPMAALAVATAVLAFLIVQRWPASEHVHAVAGDNLPTRLVPRLQQGHVFTVDGWGGLVTYERWPEVLVAYDTRIDFHGAEAFRRYWSLVLTEQEPEPWMETYCVEQVLGLDTWPLVTELEDDADWRVIGTERLGDGRSAVLLRADLGC